MAGESARVRYDYQGTDCSSLACLGLNAIEFLCGILDEDQYQTTVKEYEGPFGERLLENCINILMVAPSQVSGIRRDSAIRGSF